MRKSGILLSVTSLPSDYGIGCFSKSAYDFVDWLKEAGQSYWQILPLNPTGFGDSPYQSFSTFAGNPYMISLKELVKEGLLTKNECEREHLTEKKYIDYKKQYESRFKLLRKAYKKSIPNKDFFDFESENDFWLNDYSLFMALKYKNRQEVWNKWNEELRIREKDALEKVKGELKEEIAFWKFVQYKFFSQWQRLKEYANKKGISIIGDIPIYVSFDSADVWANPNLYELDEKLNPKFVAGCPPDGFSKTGQLWGNPLYNWEIHKKTKYKWWIERLKYAFKMYDVVRIDHFRGFDEYYSIKYKSITAEKGEWRKGPGLELFKAVEKELGKKAFIAEDLGFITNSVKELLGKCGFPGMKILEFAFDLRDTGASNDYLPHNYKENCVAYTGTHDNQTLYSWYKTISHKERKAVREYLCDFHTPQKELNIPLISLLMRSSASLCVIPLQDWLGLSDKARINIPSTTGNNWRWRADKKAFSKELNEKIKRITKLYGRT